MTEPNTETTMQRWEREEREAREARRQREADLDQALLARQTTPKPAEALPLPEWLEVVKGCPESDRPVAMADGRVLLKASRAATRYPSQMMANPHDVAPIPTAARLKLQPGQAARVWCLQTPAQVFDASKLGAYRLILPQVISGPWPNLVELLYAPRTPITGRIPSWYMGKGGEMAAVPIPDGLIVGMVELVDIG